MQRRLKWRRRGEGNGGSGGVNGGCRKQRVPGAAPNNELVLAVQAAKVGGHRRKQQSRKGFVHCKGGGMGQHARTAFVSAEFAG